MIKMSLGRIPRQRHRRKTVGVGVDVGVVECGLFRTHLHVHVRCRRLATTHAPGADRKRQVARSETMEFQIDSAAGSESGCWRLCRMAETADVELARSPVALDRVRSEAIRGRRQSARRWYVNLHVLSSYPRGPSCDRMSEKMKQLDFAR